MHHGHDPGADGLFNGVEQFAAAPSKLETRRAPSAAILNLADVTSWDAERVANRLNCHRDQS